MWKYLSTCFDFCLLQKFTDIDLNSYKFILIFLLYDLRCLDRIMFEREFAIFLKLANHHRSTDEYMYVVWCCYKQRIICCKTFEIYSPIYSAVQCLHIHIQYTIRWNFVCMDETGTGSITIWDKSICFQIFKNVFIRKFQNILTNFRFKGDFVESQFFVFFLFCVFKLKFNIELQSFFFHISILMLEFISSCLNSQM